MGICDGRVVIITGAARGLGREYALGFAAEGAYVVVNDLGGETDREASAAVAREIKAAGGKAITNHDDIADWDGAGRLIRAALEAFGTLHTVVNNAGILRIFPFEEEPLENWDRTIRVHLRGHFCVARRAVEYWHAEHSAGRPVAARIINVSSGAGLQGAAGQASYSTAKGGIASLTLTEAAELGRYGITANAIAPTARTRMTSEFWPDQIAKPDQGFDAMDPANVAPLARVARLGTLEPCHGLRVRGRRRPHRARGRLGFWAHDRPPAPLGAGRSRPRGRCAFVAAARAAAGLEYLVKRVACHGRRNS
jgi:NAD(P)-dependent dehydrogenase (short-subunit alcohol dehydrogenase family)